MLSSFYLKINRQLNLDLRNPGIFFNNQNYDKKKLSFFHLTNIVNVSFY